MITVVCILTTTALSLLAIASFAQDSTMVLTLRDAVSTALQQNKNISLALFDKKEAEANYRQTEAIFLPQANVLCGY